MKDFDNKIQGINHGGHTFPCPPPYAPKELRGGGQLLINSEYKTSLRTLLTYICTIKGQDEVNHM